MAGTPLFKKPLYLVIFYRTHRWVGVFFPIFYTLLFVADRVPFVTSCITYEYTEKYTIPEYN